MKLLMFGGTKFIGRAVVERALELGHEVAVYHRGETEPDGLPDVLHVHGDNIDVASKIDEIKAFEPDSVVDTTQFDALRTQAVIDALTGVVDRYVLVSSMDVYLAYGRLHGTEPGPYQENPLTEESALRTKPGFDHTDEFDNLHIERVARSQDALDVTIARLPGVFGPNDYQRRVGQLMDRLDESGGELRLHPLRADFHMTWGYVDNIADMLIECAFDEKPGTRIYNMGYPQPMSVMEMHRLVADLIEWSGGIVSSPEGVDAPTQNFGQQWAAYSSKFRRDFDYVERFSIEEAFRLTVAHIQQAGTPEHD